MIAESREEVEFESTFYLSCVYYILLFICLNFVWIGVVFIPWPCLRSLKHQNAKSLEGFEKFQKLLLKVNFFSEEEEKEEENSDEEEEEEHSKKKKEKKEVVL